MRRPAKWMPLALTVALLSLPRVEAAPNEPLGKHEGTAISVAYSPDGKLVASSGHVDKTARVWQVATNKELHKLTGHTNGAMCVRFSPDGKLLASSGLEEVIHFWDPATGREVGRITAPGHPYVFDFSPDGKKLASAGIDKTVRIWDVATGKEILQLAGHTGRVWSAIFSPDGKTIVSTGEDMTILFWDADKGTQLRSVNSHNSIIVPLAFSPDGKLLASGSSDRLIRLWDVATGTEVARFTGHGGLVHGLAFSPDGRVLVSGAYEDDTTVRLWEVVTGKEITQFDGHSPGVAAVAYAPDGKSVASAGRDGAVRVWDVMGGAKAPKVTERDLPGLWKDLSGDDAGKAYRAVLALASVPKEAVPFLEEKLKALSAESDESKLIAKLIAELDDDRFGVRDRASDQLKKLGRKAEGALRKTLDETTSAEVRTRIKALLAGLEGRLTPPEAVPAIRVVWALEHLATPEARNLLAAYAKGTPDMTLTREAKAALARLARDRQ